jgi:hypothetical protein
VFRCGVHRRPSSKWFRPGVSAYGLGDEHSDVYGGGGLDGVSCDLFVVLFVNGDDLCVLLYASEVLNVICVPTV